MRWNTYDFVLSADAQWNGATDDYIPDLKAYREADIKTQYQTIVSPELSRLLKHASRNFESADQETCSRIRSIDERISFPAEFFQCFCQKPTHYVDYKNRHTEFMDKIRGNHLAVNGILDRAFQTYYNGGDLDRAIYEEVDRVFASSDAEMRAIIQGYLTQKPSRAIFLIDLECSPASFQWLEPVYQTIKSHLMNWGLDHIAVMSGKGYHFVSQVPLGETMIHLMARGGDIHPETLDRLATVRWASRKKAPTPLLTQRAYQGMWKLQQYLAVNMADDIRRRLSQAGMSPWVNFSDTADQTVIMDLTSMLRQVEMGVFGSVGSIYNKSRSPVKVRMIRSRIGHEYFNNDLNWMLATRSDLKAVKAHLISSGGRIPEGTEGFKKIIAAYDTSRIKRELHEPCDRPLEPRRIAGIFESNYSEVRRRCPQIRNDLEKAQPNFLNPKALNWIYGQLASKGYSIHEMMTLTKAVYSDPAKNVDIDPKYSKDEWSRWPMLLMGENFKG